METRVTYRNVYSPPVKWNCFTGGGGIFGFAKNLENNYEQEIDGAGLEMDYQTFTGVTVCNNLNSSTHGTGTVRVTKQQLSTKNYRYKFYIDSKPTAPTYSGYELGSTSVLYQGSSLSSMTDTASNKSFSASDFKIQFQYISAVKTYSITYNPNGGSGSITYGNPTEAGKSFTTKSSSTYTRTGYDFYHWSESATSSINTSSYYAASTSYAMPSRNLYLYAKWNPILYNISLNPNNGSVNGSTSTLSYSYDMEGESTSAFGASLLASLPSATRTGYTFAGWLVSGSSSGNWNGGSLHNANTSLSGKYGSVTLVAQWAANDYTLDINANKDGVYAMDYVGGYQDPEGYATFDMYINGSCVANDVGDFCQPVAYGSSYEIRDIKLNYDKAYEGAFLDGPCTNATSLSGTMPAERLDIFLKLRTKTWNDYAASSFASGSGTAASPYIIKTAEQLAKVSKDSRSSTLSGKHYKLGADIDLSAHVWEGIGGHASKFAGTLDGDLHQIKNIKTSVDNFKMEESIGLFAYVINPCVIKNIIIKGGTVTAGKRYDCGVIVGGNDTDVQIMNCIVDGVTLCDVANNASGGGIAGRFTGGTISNCLVVNCTITSNGTAAGICGWRGTIKDCAVINTAITYNFSETSSFIVGWESNSTINSSYGVGTCNGTAVKQMHGDSSAWGNWTYNANLNGGYPVQKTLFHIGGMSGSEAVYNYLKNTLGFTV